MLCENFIYKWVAYLTQLFTRVSQKLCSKSIRKFIRKGTSLRINFEDIMAAFGKFI